ncbi:MAG: MBOAT family O-acyltransferase [Pseudobdellovibrio sp.]
MSYNNPLFFLSMIAGVFLFLLSPGKFRPVILLLASLLWYYTWGPFWCGCLFAYTTILYLVIKKFRPYTFLIILNIFLFLFLKSVPYFFSHLSSPNGVSFYFFNILGFLIDQKRSKSNEFKIKFFNFLLFPTYFLTLLAGPVLRADSFFEQLRNTERASFKNIVDGSIIFFTGFFKLQLLIFPLTEITTQLFANYKADHIYFWFSCFLSTLRAYIEFSSYCDMGRGISRCFGIDLQVNFKSFYYSKSPIDFWNRWNITIGGWLRDYFSFPLMLKFGKQINQSILIMFSFLLLGLWHGIGFNWALFGLFNGAMVSSFFFLSRKFASRPHWINFLGRFQALLIFVGNGLLAKADFLQLLSLDRPLNSYIDLNFSLIPFSLFLATLLVFEFFQEKYEETDFYLAWPSSVKNVLAVLLLSLFCYRLTLQISEAHNILPPLYFRF